MRRRKMVQQLSGRNVTLSLDHHYPEDYEEEESKFVNHDEKFFDADLHDFGAENSDRYRLRARLTVEKDDVQTVLPIAKVQ